MSHTKKPTIEKIILALLGLLALAALVRTMFLGLEIDEEYALSLGFRLVRGDRLFYSMWEPHQLAALPPALLIGLFTAVAGTTTGVLLFVRGAVLAVKLALAVWFYRSLRGALGGRCAYLLALAVLAFTPKWFLGPDYVSQQFHFTLAAFLFLYGYYAPGPRSVAGRGGRRLRLSELPRLPADPRCRAGADAGAAPAGPRQYRQMPRSLGICADLCRLRRCVCRVCFAGHGL